MVHDEVLVVAMEIMQCILLMQTIAIVEILLLRNCSVTMSYGVYVHTYIHIFINNRNVYIYIEQAIFD